MRPEILPSSPSTRPPGFAYGGHPGFAYGGHCEDAGIDMLLHLREDLYSFHFYVCMCVCLFNLLVLL